MSVPAWLFFLMILLGFAIPLGIAVLPQQPEDDDKDTDDAGNDTEELDENSEKQHPPVDDEADEEFQGSLDQSDVDEDEGTDQSDPSENHNETGEQFPIPPDPLEILDDEFELQPYTEPTRLNERQSTYDDREEPDASSEALKSAVQWLIDASTEAIHQKANRKDFLEYLRTYIEEPRANGADIVSQTRWRELSPNLSRLIGERLLVMSLGLSCYGNLDMDAHRQAFLALLDKTWSEDRLEHPLLHQCIGRMSLLSDTDLSSLGEDLRAKIPGRVIRDDQPNLTRVAEFHAILFAVGSGNVYPFPRSDKGLSRLWHWDEHNPPLAEIDQLPACLYALWLYYQTGGDTSQAANDYGAMLGNWWNEEEPDVEYFESNPSVWEAILLTAWVLLIDQPIIWEQLEERRNELSFENDYLNNVTDEFLSWVETYRESGSPPDQAPSRESLPPTPWIQPLPSDLLRDFSEPSFDYPNSWCETLTDPSEPDVDNL